MFAGRVASEWVVLRERAEDGLDGAAVGLEGGMKSVGGVQQECCATSDA